MKTTSSTDQRNFTNLSVKKIIERIKSLQVQQESLVRELAHRAEGEPEPKKKGEPDLKIGDRVEIINNYRRLKGTTGEVTRVTEKYVDIRTPIGSIRRKKKNVKNISHE